jgi:hypothetical protein
VHVNMTCVPNTPPPSRVHWVRIEWVDETGATTGMDCRTTWDRISADQLRIPADDLGSVVAGLCSAVWSS